MIISSVEQLGDVRKLYPNQTIALGTGCFDLVHPGHIEHLQRVASVGQVAIIAILGDRKVGELKPGRPIAPEKHRAKVIDAFGCVDYTLVEPYSSGSGRKSMMDILDHLRPDYFVVDETWGPFHEQIRSFGTEVRAYDNVSNKIDSTTDMIRRAITSAALVDTDVPGLYPDPLYD